MELCELIAALKNIEKGLKFSDAKVYVDVDGKDCNFNIAIFNVRSDRRVKLVTKEKV